MTCKHYYPVVESYMVQTGEDEYGWPIGEEQHELVAERCHHPKKNCYIFEHKDCKDCKLKEEQDG